MSSFVIVSSMLINTQDIPQDPPPWYIIRR